MANTYTLIASNILSASTASVTFSSIPATYTDLVVRMSTRGDYAATSLAVNTTFNGDTASNYSSTLVANYNGSAISSAQANTTSIRLGPWTEGTSMTTSTFANSEVYIPSYTASQYKPVSSSDVLENNASAGWVLATAGLWRNNAAITSINLAVELGNFVSTSSFYLYGIKSS